MSLEQRIFDKLGATEDDWYASTGERRDRFGPHYLPDVRVIARLVAAELADWHHRDCESLPGPNGGPTFPCDCDDL